MGLELMSWVLSVEKETNWKLEDMFIGFRQIFPPSVYITVVSKAPSNHQNEENCPFLLHASDLEPSEAKLRLEAQQFPVFQEEEASL